MALCLKADITLKTVRKITRSLHFSDQIVCEKPSEKQPGIRLQAQTTPNEVRKVGVI